MFSLSHIDDSDKYLNEEYLGRWDYAVRKTKGSIRSVLRARLKEEDLADKVLGLMIGLPFDILSIPATFLSELDESGCLDRTGTSPDGRPVFQINRIKSISRAYDDAGI